MRGWGARMGRRGTTTNAEREGGGRSEYLLSERGVPVAAPLARRRRAPARARRGVTLRVSRRRYVRHAPGVKFTRTLSSHMRSSSQDFQNFHGPWVLPSLLGRPDAPPAPRPSAVPPPRALPRARHAVAPRPRPLVRGGSARRRGRGAALAPVLGVAQHALLRLAGAPSPTRAASPRRTRRTPRARPRSRRRRRTARRRARPRSAAARSARGARRGGRTPARRRRGRRA